MKRMLGLYVCVLICQFLLGNTAMATCVFYDNEADWMSALGGDYNYAPFDADHLGNPSIGTDFNGVPVPSSQSGLHSSFEIDVAYSLIFKNLFDVNETTSDYDWWDISFGSDVYAFAMLVLDNNEKNPEYTAYESLTIHDDLNNSMSIAGTDTSFDWPQGTHTFIGVVSTRPIVWAHFEEDSEDDNIDLGGLYMSPVPEPASMVLLMLGGVAMVGRRRKN